MPRLESLVVALRHVQNVVLLLYIWNSRSLTLVLVFCEMAVLDFMLANMLNLFVCLMLSIHGLLGSGNAFV